MSDFPWRLSRLDSLLGATVYVSTRAPSSPALAFRAATTTGAQRRAGNRGQSRAKAPAKP